MGDIVTEARVGFKGWGGYSGGKEWVCGMGGMGVTAEARSGWVGGWRT